MKRILLFISLLLIAIFSSIACTLPYNNKSYSDTILNLYMSEDKRTLVLISTKYHYVFKDIEQQTEDFFVAQTLLKYTANDLDYSMSLDDNNSVNLNLYLTMKGKALTSEQKDWLESHNFHTATKEGNPSKDFYSGGAFAYGKRYKSSSTVNENIIKLPKPIDIKIAEMSNSEKADKTPLKFDEVLSIDNNLLFAVFKKEN